MRLRLQCQHLPLAAFLALPPDAQQTIGRNDHVYVVHEDGSEVDVSTFVLIGNAPRLHEAAATPGMVVDIVVLKKGADGQVLADGDSLATETVRATVSI